MRYKIMLVCAFSLFLVLSSMAFTLQVLADHAPRPQVVIVMNPDETGVIRTGVIMPPPPPPDPPRVSDGGTIQIAQGQSVRVQIQIVGADQNDNNHFECRWIGGSFGSTNTFQRNNCGTLVSVGPRTNMTTGIEYTSVISSILVSPDLRASTTPYTFEVKVVDDQGAAISSFASSEVRRFTFTVTTRATPTPPPTPIDPTAIPKAGVYKPNSYQNYATSPPSLYHLDINNRVENGKVTQYRNMYIVFEGWYRGVSDMLAFLGTTPIRTTFQCSWDNQATVPCGRFNIITDVGVGLHTVDFKAVNPRGMEGPLSHFDWCVADPGLDCTSGIRAPPTPIPMGHVRFYDAADVSFYPGKNETITLEELKKFPILKEKIAQGVTQADMESPAQADMESPAQGTGKGPDVSAGSTEGGGGADAGSGSADTSDTSGGGSGEAGGKEEGKAETGEQSPTPEEESSGDSASKVECSPNEDFDLKTGKCIPEIPG